MLTKNKQGDYSPCFTFFDGSTVNYDYDVLDELIGKSYDNEEDPQAIA